MTNNERLYEIIDKHRHDVDMDFSADIRHYKNTNETVDGIISLIKELVAEAEADIKLWVDDEVIGSDERHSNGKKMVNYWSCEDCGTPEEAWTRNQLRADQRKRLWLEKFEQNLLKALEDN